MYAMVSLNMAELNIPNDMMFAETLLREENVFVLPGSCFGIANAFRVVYCGPPAVLEQAAQRIVSFCQRHQV